jgi:hypothetical protein
MIIITKDQANTFASGTTTIDEYLMDVETVSGAVARITTRYPDRGFASNKISKEIVYITEGEGRMIQPDLTTAFTAGDVLFIDAGESFAWEGKFSMFIVTAPKFDPAQHKIT